MERYIVTSIQSVVNIKQDLLYGFDSSDFYELYSCNNKVLKSVNENGQIKISHSTINYLVSWE